MKKVLFFLVFPSFLFAGGLSQSEMNEYVNLVNTPHPLINNCWLANDDVSRACYQRHFSTCWVKFPANGKTLAGVENMVKLHECAEADQPANVTATQRNEYARFLELKAKHLSSQK